MFTFRNKNKPRERFYLLPGQGGRNYYLKQRKLLTWAVVVSVVFGALLGLAMWVISQRRP